LSLRSAQSFLKKKRKNRKKRKKNAFIFGCLGMEDKIFDKKILPEIQREIVCEDEVFKSKMK
jgi:hypothetical protein